MQDRDLMLAQLADLFEAEGDPRAKLLREALKPDPHCVVKAFVDGSLRMDTATLSCARNPMDGSLDLTAETKCRFKASLQLHPERWRDRFDASDELLEASEKLGKALGCAYTTIGTPALLQEMLWHHRLMDPHQILG